MWVGVNERRVIGLYFFDGPMNEPSYFKLLVIACDIVDGRPFCWTQNSFPARWCIYLFPARCLKILKRTFSVVDRTQLPHSLASLSPDLTFLDFSVWGLMKDRVFARELDSLDALKNSIVA